MNETYPQQASPEEPGNEAGASGISSGKPSQAAPQNVPIWPSRQFVQTDQRAKSVALATVMSIMPGLGQVYVGYYLQGFTHILVVASLITLLNRGVGALEPLFGMFLAFFWLYNLVDAGRRAVYYNQALAGMDPTELPDAIPTVRGKGSLVGGVVMILFGLLVLAHTRFGLPLDWLEQWWPLALVLTGGYIVYRSAIGNDGKDA